MKANNRSAQPTRPTSLNLTLDEPVMRDLVACVQLAHNPSVHAYYTLKAEIEKSSPRWMAQYLDLGGLDAFLDALCQLTGHKFTNFSDAVLQLDCIGCIRAVFNCPVGMQHAVQRPESVYKLMQGLDTPNTLPKKQILELVTAIAMYSTYGHGVIMEALATYKKLTNQQHVFSFLVNELKNSDTATYRVTLMSLINVILRGHLEVDSRSRVREQFIALNLLDVMVFIRRDDRDPELSVQFQIFDDDKHIDEELLLSSHGIDVTNPQQLFALLHSKTCLTPESNDLLRILQDLVTMATQKRQSGLLWQTVSQAVHHIIGLEPDQLEVFSQNLQNNCDKTHKDDEKSQKDDEKLQKDDEKSQKDDTCDKKTSQANDTEAGNCVESDHAESNKLVVYGKLDKSDNNSQDSASSVGAGRRDSGISVTSPYDNVLENGVFKRQGSGRGSIGPSNRPKPQKQVKPVIWETLRVRDTQKPLSVWRMVTERSYRQKITLDYASLETEFEQTQSTEGVTDAGDEIHLLEVEESLRLNLLLARLEAMPEDLADSVIEGDTSDLTRNDMRLLLDAIPPWQQIARIQASTSPHFTLAPAEQFLAFLSEQTDYMTLLQGLKFKVTFQTQFPRLQGAFESLIISCRDVLHHHGLRDFMRLMLDAGNFLNAGHNLDPAGGVKLSSWRRLLKVKGQDHSSNLLSYLVRVTVNQDDGAVMFADNFPLLKQASGYCLDDLKREVTDLNMQMKQFMSQLSQSDPKVKDKYQDFIEEVKRDLASLHSNIARLKGLSSQMALYFCEQEIAFDLQSCLKDLQEFFKAVKDCQKNSVIFCHQEAAAVKHKEELEKKMEDIHIMKYFGKKADLCSSFVRAQNDPLVDHILGEIHRGNIIYYHDNQLKTPDIDDKLGVSVIPRIISTPIDDLEADLESSSFIFHTAGSLFPPTYVDRVEKVTDVNYHREEQRKTSSFVAEGLAPRASNETLEDTLVSNYKPGELAARCRPTLRPANTEIMIYPKIQTPVPSARKHGHMRCSSDLDSSRVVEDRWKTYERQKEAADCFPVPGDVLESCNMVQSLALEPLGVRKMDVSHLPKRKVFFLEPEKPVKDKKKKVGFFQRLSQAVLRPKNANTAQGHDDGLSKELTRGSKRWSGRGRKSKKNADKENVIVENLV